MAKQGRLLVAALICVGATFLPLVIGFALEFDPFKIWGVVSAYLGVSWLLPGLFIGFATTEWTKERGPSASGQSRNFGRPRRGNNPPGRAICDPGCVRCEHTMTARPRLARLRRRPAR
jgi:hypothetical protein